MDRDALESFLRSGHRTWWWRDDIEDPDHHRGVETTDRGLRWFAWSHLHGEDGLTEESYQSYDAFLSEGPSHELPPAIGGQLRDWVATFRQSRG